jgi:large subunit ribosomal protein L6
MSRIGKKPIEIPEGVKVEQSGRTVKVSGKQGSLQFEHHPSISVKVEDQKIIVQNPRENNRFCRSMHGTTRALIANMVTGVNKGFEKKMEVYGTGYNVKEQSGKLIIQVGHSHPVKLAIPQGVNVTIQVAATRGDDVPAKFTLLSADKTILGRFAAEIRKIRPPEPYKGKGIRYADEVIRRKAGKAFASGAV